MAALGATARAGIARKIQRAWSDLREGCAFTKAHLAAAVDATDAWIDGNQTSFNSALPAQFRNSATLQQKTLLFCFVAARRAGFLDWADGD
jgi:hypothetical protein